VAGYPSYLDDQDADDDFLSGEGPIDSGARIRCPYCGIVNEITLDLSSGRSQDYLEECEVCCRPWQVRVIHDQSGRVIVEVNAADEP
jgi:hypothetical protein